MLNNSFLTLQSNQPVTIGFIKTWLLENKDSFNDTIEKTECYKWKSGYANKNYSLS